MNNTINQLCDKTAVKLPSVADRIDKYEMLKWFLERFFGFTKSDKILQINSDVRIWVEKEVDWSKEYLTIGILEDLAAYAVLRGIFDGKIQRQSFLDVDNKAQFDLVNGRANYFREVLYREKK